MIKDISVTMASNLTAGEEWVVDWKELPDGTVNQILPNPTTNPIVIPNKDTEKCYVIGVSKKCASGYLGERRAIQIGECPTGIAVPCQGLVTFENLLPGHANQWAIVIDLPVACIANTDFTIEWEATRTDVSDSYSGSAVLTVEEGETTAVLYVTDGLANETLENWTVTSNTITNISPTGQYTSMDCAYSFTALTSPCAGIYAAYQLSGHEGDTVVLRLTFSGMVHWTGSGGGAGAAISISAEGVADSDTSPHITTSVDTSFSLSAEITFVMPASTVVIDTTAVLHNTTITGIAAATMTLVSVNGVAKGLSTGVCRGTSGGTW